MESILVILMLLFGIGVNSPTQIVEPPRPLNQIIDYTEHRLQSDDWHIIGAYENYDRAYVSFENCCLRAVLAIDFWAEDIDLSAILYDEVFFNALLGNYAPFEQIGTCDQFTIKLYEHHGIFDSIEYTSRFWVDYAPADLAQRTQLHLVFPTEKLDILDEYAGRFVPDLPTCSSDNLK